MATRIGAFLEPTHSGYLCTCGQRHAPGAEVAAAVCWLTHTRVAVRSYLEGLLPSSSTPGKEGLWLSPGETCPACGDASGGWVCAGMDAHCCPCHEASLHCLGAHSRTNLLQNEVQPLVRLCVHTGADWRNLILRTSLEPFKKAVRHEMCCRDPVGFCCIGITPVVSFCALLHLATSRWNTCG